MKKVYYILLIGFFNLLALSVFAQNPTDACGAGVQLLVSGGSCSISAYSLPGNYANSGAVNAFCATGSDVDDGWYRFVATGTSTTVEVSGDEDRVVAISTGSCGTGELACDMQASGTTASATAVTVIGVTYYIQVHRRSGNNNAAMAGTVCVHAAGGAAGGSCDYTLEMNDTYGDGWNGASVDVYINGVFFSSHTCAVYQTVDVISIPDGATVTLGYNSGGFDSEASYIFYDAQGNVLFADGTSPAIGGAVYGPIVLNCPLPPDAPCSALAASTACGPKSTGSIGGLTDSGVANPGCGNYQGGDLWYVLTIPASGNVDIEGKVVSGGVNDIAIAAYTAATCGGAKTLVSCNDNSGTGNMPYLSLTGLTAGNDLYVRTWEPGNNASGAFELEITNPDNLFCLTNDATMYNFPADTCMQVTPNATSQVGCAWYQNTIDFSQDFDHTMEVYLGTNDGGADGMTFTFHNDPQGTTECGSDGQNLGAGGIENSVVIEIDTYDNGGNDPNDDHVAIWTSASGEGSPISGPVAATAPASNIEDGVVHTLRITWNSTTNTMEVYFDGTLRLSVSNDFVTNIFGTSNVFWGSTGSTGGFSNQHYVCPPSSLTSLPIELVRFTSMCDNSGAKLLWATASEISNDYFTIERSIDAVNFEAVDYVEGAGNSNDLKEYTWKDKNPVAGISYYRLRQTDFDGKFSYSSLKTASCKEESKFDIYPNPVLDRVMLSSTSEFKVQYQIITMDGRVIDEGAFLKNKKIDLTSLSSGAYFVKAISKDEIFQEKLIKK